MNALRIGLPIILLFVFATQGKAQTWDELNDGGSDAGNTLLAAHDLTASEYTLITGSISVVGDVDLYKINVLEASNFSATSVKASYVGGDLNDSWLFLFDSSGNAIYSNDDSPVGDPGSNSLLPKTGDAANNPSGFGPLTAGTYYLAIGSYEEKALDALTVDLFEDPRNFGLAWTRINGPNSAAGSLASWNGAGAQFGNYEITLAGVALPVELSSLDATSDDRMVTLRWTTLSESNNAGFDVEVAGHQKQYQSVGFVQGNGTTTEKSDYMFSVDGLPYGTHTFRLRQVNFDGSSDYSPIVEVELGISQSHLISSVYPNPLDASAQVEVVVREEQSITIELHNMVGQRVSTVFSGTLGANQTKTIPLATSRLSSGQYLMTVRGTGFRDTQLISVVK